MILHVYSVMRNERILLPYYFRHYDQIASQYFIWDDNSDDGSREMLEAHPNVTIMPLEKHGINDPYWVQELWPQYKTLSRGIADWVIVVDVDEFVYMRAWDYQLRAYRGIGAVLYCQGYSMVADTLPTTQGQIYDEFQRGLPDKWSNKWVVFDPAIDIQYQPGRHYTPHCGKGTMMERDSGLKLLHYRYLGAEFFEERDRRNVESYNISEGQGLVYDPNRRRNLADGSRGVPLQWFASHKAQTVKVVE